MSCQKKILFLFGTRPEALKLAPVIRAFQDEIKLEVRICVTAQHRELLDQALLSFRIKSDFDLNLMLPDQSLPGLISRIVAAAGEVLDRERPDLVIVQGDTASALGGALAASLCKIPIAHVEAGLRSFRRGSPFPEEINRVLISRLADLHFAPSESAAENLRREGITGGIFVVGNPIVDSLKNVLRDLKGREDEPRRAELQAWAGGRRIVLLTLHRRESFGDAMTNICRAIREIAMGAEDMEFFFPVHPNGRVRDTIREQLSDIKNVRLLDPLAYEDFVWLLSRATLVISDSGGVLEEAVTMGVPILVVREITERVDAIRAGHAQIAGVSVAQIVAEARTLLQTLTNSNPLRRTLRETFGDGKTSARIVMRTKEFLCGGSGAAVAKVTPQFTQ